MSYDGSIFAFIGADTKDYEKAMNDVIATTKKAFDSLLPQHVPVVAWRSAPVAAPRPM